MRLLILTPEYRASGGGIATFYRHLAPALTAAGVSVRVIEGSALHTGDPTPCDLDGAMVEALDHDRLRRWEANFGRYAAMPALRRHLSAAWAMWEQAGFGEGADVVEASDWGLLFVPPALEARVPLIVQALGSLGQVSEHDPIAGQEAQDAFIRMLESALLPRCPLQTVSRANAEFWRLNAGVSATEIRPGWTPCAGVHAQSLSSRGLVVGRLQSWKGPHILCRALRDLGGKAPDVDWVGRDMPWRCSEVMTSQHLAKSFPDVWGARLLRHDPEPPIDIARRQALAAFNVVPSTWDVFNFTAIEAMASGRPTIVSSGAGASELVEDGVNGFVFRSEDAADLAGKIDQLLSMPPARQRELGRAAQETVLCELQPARSAEARVNAYRSVIGAFRSSPPAPIGGWLADACRPGLVTPDATADYLGQLPLRTLAAHLSKRVRRKAAGALAASLRR